MTNSAHTPGSGEEREDFWELLREFSGNFIEREKVIVMMYVNVKIDDTAKDAIIGIHGPSGISEIHEYRIYIYEMQVSVRSTEGL